MTESARQALVGLRDFSTLQWYVIPLLVLLLLIYANEIREARRTRDWDCLSAPAQFRVPPADPARFESPARRRCWWRSAVIG